MNPLTIVSLRQTVGWAMGVEEAGPLLEAEPHLSEQHRVHHHA